MNNPIRTNKEDRYLSEESQSASNLSQSFLMNRKLLTIMVTSIIIVLLLIIIYLLFNRPIQYVDVSNNHLTNSDSIERYSQGYQTLTPPSISSNSISTSSENAYTGKERIEISDDVAERMSQMYNSNNTLIEFNSQNTYLDIEHNELPLGKTLPNDHYTIQLVATSSLESIMAFAKSHKLTNYQIYETRRENKPWFVLIKGSFTNIKDAKTVIQNLPLELQRNSPWVKSGTVVNREKLVLQ